MPPTESVIRAHDELLASKPEHVGHDCAICQGRITETAKETEVPGDDKARTFTEAEHEAILTEAVRREVASATESLETQTSELQNRIDVLEAEKAEALTARDAAKQELEDFKAELDHEREVSSRRESRIAAVKEISATVLPDEYFSDERVTRWAEMADEAFDALLDDLAEQSIAHLDDRQVTEIASLEGEARRKKIAEFVGERKEQAKEHGEVTKPDAGRETAAFSGGKSPASGGGSSLGAWLGARGHAPATD